MTVNLANKSLLVVGAGGLGCPALLALVGSGVGRILIADDDVVDESNLHRQILFDDRDIGAPKLERARDALVRRGMPRECIELVRGRFLPANARDLARAVDLVVEGADNYPTKFLVADACYLERTPVVHGAALGWRATIWSVSGAGRPCYRCLFEDLPTDGDGPNCNTAGVMGPVTGFAGALMADLALTALEGGDRSGTLFAYDALRDAVRTVTVPPRPGCDLCGSAPRIAAIEESRYEPAFCAA